MRASQISRNTCMPLKPKQKYFPKYLIDQDLTIPIAPIK